MGRRYAGEHALKGSHKKPRSKAQKAAAYREAGHAVAAWDACIMLLPVSIFANGPGAGRNVWNQALRNVNFEWVQNADSRALVGRLAAVVMAGPVAQRAFAAGEPQGAVCKKRLGEVKQLLKAVPGTAYAEAFERTENQLRKFFAKKDVGRTVVALSSSLLEHGTLHGNDVVTIIERNLTHRR
jgi:hypothetical protein